MGTTLPKTKYLAHHSVLNNMECLAREKFENFLGRGNLFSYVERENLTSLFFWISRSSLYIGTFMDFKDFFGGPLIRFCTRFSPPYDVLFFNKTIYEKRDKRLKTTNSKVPKSRLLDGVKISPP